MKCAGCGKEIAQTAHFCNYCSARQASSDARSSELRVAGSNAAGAVPGSAAAQKRGVSIAFVVGTGIAIALVAAATWRVLEHGTQPRETPAPTDATATVAAGQVPPPANESAAPLPPPAALPPSGPETPAAEGVGGSDAAGADTSTVEESAASSATPSAESSPHPASASGKNASPRVRREATAKPPKPAHPPPATMAAAAPAKPSSPAANPAPPGAVESAPANEHWARMEEDMAKCTREDFISRVICAQRVKFRYCGGYWGKVPQCPGSPPSDHG